MKKLIKLISLLVVLAALVICYFVYSGSVKDDTSSENQNTNTGATVEVLYLEPDTLNTIDFEFDEQPVSLKKNGDVWEWAEDADFPLEQSYALDMVDALSYIMVDRIIEETLENEADYGMDEPNFTVKYTTDDGKEYVYTIGDYNQAAQGYYVKSSEHEKIFMTKNNPVSPFVYTLLEMAAVDSLDSPKAESISKLECVIAGESYIIDKDGTAVEYPDPYNYFVYDENGNKVGADGNSAGELMSAVASMCLGDVLEFKADEETLEKYGLGQVKTLVLNVEYEEAVGTDSTDTSVSVTTKKNYSVNIGKYANEEGSVEYYATVDGSLLLYELRGGEALFAALEADFESKLVCPILADGVVAFTATTASGEKAYTASDIESNESIAEILNTLASIVSKDAIEGEKGESVLKVTFDLGGKELVFEAWTVDETSCIASFCGEEKFVDNEKIQKVIELIG